MRTKEIEQPSPRSCHFSVSDVHFLNWAMQVFVVRKHSREFCWAVLCATVWWSPLLAQASAPEFVGYVFEIRGSWRTGPQYASDLRIGQGVRNGDVIKLMIRRPDASIHVGLIDQTAAVRDCNVDATKCETDLPIKLTSQDPDFWKTLGSIWSRLTAPSQPQLIFTMSRGADSGSREPEEAILSLRNGTPDLAPALAKIKNGQFDATLTTSGRAPIRLKVHWISPKATITGPKVQAGLYSLEVMAGGAAPVLIVPSEQVATLAGTFQKAQVLAASWPEEIGDQSRHVFLALVLHALGRQSRLVN